MSDSVVPIAEFEGEFVRSFEGRLPAIQLDMPEGYRRGTHLKLEVEVRVRNIGYDEQKSRSKDIPGDLSRIHTFALEEVKLVDAFDPANRPTNVGGNSAGDAWVDHLMEFLDGETDELNFDGEEIPERLQEMLKAYFDALGEVPTGVGSRSEADDEGDDGVGF